MRKSHVLQWNVRFPRESRSEAHQIIKPYAATKIKKFVKSTVLLLMHMVAIRACLRCCTRTCVDVPDSELRMRCNCKMVDRSIIRRDQLLVVLMMKLIFLASSCFFLLGFYSLLFWVLLLGNRIVGDWLFPKLEQVK